jgi:sarcosine oxidase delta subunit
MRCTCMGDNEKMTCSYCDDRIDEMEWEAAGISDISGVDPIGAEDSREYEKWLNDR